MMKLLKNILRKIYNVLNIKKRLIAAYFLLIVLPIVLFLVITNQRTYQSLKTMVDYSATNSFQQTMIFLENKLNYCKEVSETIIVSDTLNEVIRQSRSVYEEDIYRKVGMLSRLRSINNTFSKFKDIYKIRYYITEDNGFINNDFYLDENAVAGEGWYQALIDRTSNEQWVSFINDDLANNNVPTISLLRTITDFNDYSKRMGILRIDLDKSTINQILENAQVTSNTKVYLVDNNNQLMASSDEDVELISNDKLNQLIAKGDDLFTSYYNNKYLVGARTIKDTPLTLVVMIPDKEITILSNRVKFDLILLVLVISITAAIFAVIMANITIKRRNYELKALQGQINPHFLYNTLDFINWTAMEYNATEISDIVKQVSKYYKLSLNKGKDTISIREELEHANLYVEIVNYRLDKKIKLFFDIDESIYDYKILNIIFQPIIENSILHGILEWEDSKGLIVISGHINDNIIKLSVSDDGKGMPYDKVQSLMNLDENELGYGLKNIHERIKLVYGNKYGLSVNSTIGNGTTVTIKIPAILQ